MGFTVTDFILFKRCLAVYIEEEKITDFEKILLFIFVDFVLHKNGLIVDVCIHQVFVCGIKLLL